MRVLRPALLALVLTLPACDDAAPVADVAPAGLPAPVLPAIPYPYASDAAQLPAHFVLSPAGSIIAIDNMPASNPITNPGATLGRVLFYDVRLSVNDRVSCASCHKQQFGFADTARFSRGHDGRRTARRTMSLANARFYRDGHFFWDERAPSLEAQVVMPIQDAVEMGMSLDALEAKLAATAFYPALFESAFGTPHVTRERIARALAQFVRSLVSARAPFDSAFIRTAQPDFTRLTPLARQGMQIFADAGCALCHRTNAHIGDSARNTGLDPVSMDTAAGAGRFKVPSLRNVAVRAPYMHDGRFPTLHAVVDFYDSGVHPNIGLDPRLKAADGSARKLRLSEGQRQALIAFLESLTDTAFLHAPQYSNPFAPR